MLDLTQRQWVGYTVLHPFEGFEDMRWKKGGSLKIAMLIVLLGFFAAVAHDRLCGFQFRTVSTRDFSIIPYIAGTIVVFAAWVTGNWSVCTLLDGEGTMRNICIYSAYSLVPFITQAYINVLLSHILIREEQIFMQLITLAGTLWSVIMLCSAVRAVHQYTLGKTLLAILLTIAAMAVMLCLLVLVLSLLQQIWLFICTIYTELTYRIRV